MKCVHAKAPSLHIAAYHWKLKAKFLLQIFSIIPIIMIEQETSSQNALLGRRHLWKIVARSMLTGLTSSEQRDNRGTDMNGGSIECFLAVLTFNSLRKNTPQRIKNFEFFYLKNEIDVFTHTFWVTMASLAVLFFLITRPRIMRSIPVFGVFHFFSFAMSTPSLSQHTHAHSVSVPCKKKKKFKCILCVILRNFERER